MPLDRIVVWNRTDNGLGSRLADSQVIVLDAARQPVWRQSLPTAPAPSTELLLSSGQPVDFVSAAGRLYAGRFFGRGRVRGPRPCRQRAGPSAAKPASRTRIADRHQGAVEIAAGWKLIVTLEYTSKWANHTLGRFRLSTSNDGRAMQFSGTPKGWSRRSACRWPSARPSNWRRSKSIIEIIAPELVAVRGQIAGLNKQLTDMKPDTVPIMRELPADKQRVTKIQRRGNFLDVGDVVTAGTPAVFPPLPADVPVNRLALARWLVDDNNPLTARVAANRYWEQIFGIGIVATSEDFGTQGDQPVHRRASGLAGQRVGRLSTGTRRHCCGCW